MLKIKGNKVIFIFVATNFISLVTNNYTTLENSIIEVFDQQSYLKIIAIVLSLQMKKFQNINQKDFSFHTCWVIN